VELTAAEHDALEAIRFEFDCTRHRPADWEMRPSTKPEYHAKRDRLDAIKKAWEALDHDTQWHLISGVVAMWADEANDQLPDVAPIVDGLLEEMKKPTGAPEQLVGVRRATLLFWSAWCRGQLGGDVPIGSAAIAEIGAALGALYGIPSFEAERRARNSLRKMEKEGILPRRATTRRE